MVDSLFFRHFFMGNNLSKRLDLKISKGETLMTF